MPEIPIIFEDQNLLVINKPAGLMVHPDKFNKDKTLVDWLIKKYPSVKGVGENSDRPGIVHRLDKDTSGVLVIAKNQPTFLELKNLFKTGAVKKMYEALVYGKIKNERGLIDRAIGRSRSDARKRQAIGKISGKRREARTLYVLKKYLGKFSLLNLYPETGRTHQLRVHLSAIGYPIVSDALYAPKNLLEISTALPIMKRQALHARRLTFTLFGKNFEFEAPLPTDFSQTIDYLMTL